ncbi:MAG: 6-phosphogluconolactonase [Clostridia bacterium]|nr:6-phosphogluconolactonase [Clostridia bacterium]
MGLAAARAIAGAVRRLLDKNEEINMIFAAAPSQNEVLAALADDASVDWSRINAFHMDEYIGLSADAPQGFGNFLRRAIFDRLRFRSVSFIDPTAPDAGAEAERYAGLIRKNPPHITVMGIGENGHVAFNDPPVADLHDPLLAKTVALDEVCRNQQVHDGCFEKLSDVPTHAVTLTVPALMAAEYAFCVVPAATKAEAVRRTLTWPVGEACPATALREHPNAVLYLDPDSSSLIRDLC